MFGRKQKTQAALNVHLYGCLICERTVFIIQSVSLQEQYEREQEKLKKEWEKAQLEVAEEERKHNEEVARRTD